MIGTPGRVIDLVGREMLDLTNVGYLVLDEADRMLDMGFMPQIQAIIDNLNQKRQTVMFSATWPKEVEALSNMIFQNDPVKVKIGDASLTVNHLIEQNIYQMNQDDKFKKTCEIIESNEKL